MQKHRVLYERMAKYAPYILMTVIAVTLTALAINPVPWLPAERVAINHFGTITGYVLDESVTSLAILTADGRRIEYFDIDAVISRQLCDEPPVSSLFESLPQLASPP